MKEYRVVVQDDWTKIDCKNIWILRNNIDGKRHIVEPISEFTLRLLEENELSPKPTMKISSSMAQALVDSLMREGFMPDREAKIHGMLEATKYHLEDLRGLLKIK